MITVIARRRSKNTCRAGLSLIDVVITVLIIGILATVAAPKFVKSLHRMQAEAAAKRIKIDLGYTRQTAISESATRSVTFTPSSNAYSIPGVPDLDRPGEAYAVELNAPPYNATLVSAALGADSEIQFDRFGKPDSGGTITVESGGYQETVTIDPETGKASIP
jgi:Tfp pilus assembly protein PilE